MLQKHKIQLSVVGIIFLIGFNSLIFCLSHIITATK